jgi:ribosome biogenesis GTPase A
MAKITPLSELAAKIEEIKQQTLPLEKIQSDIIDALCDEIYNLHVVIAEIKYSKDTENDTNPFTEENLKALKTHQQFYMGELK